MAKFIMELPKELISEFDKFGENVDKMMGDMTQAAAKVVVERVKQNVPRSWYSSEIMNCLMITDVYRTPSDDGINTKVTFYGYFYTKDGRLTPAPLVCNVTEYGRSSSKYPKHPFFRKSFNKTAIEDEMLKVQRKYFDDYFGVDNV